MDFVALRANLAVLSKDFNHMCGKLFIISAPSGAGKTSLVDAVLCRLKPVCSIDRAITYTSRCKRKGEQEGVDFHFLSDDEFKCRIDQGFFVEWSCEYGHYYGSPACIVDDLQVGCSRILVIDRKGAMQVLEHIKDPVLIWIQVKNLDVLKSRLLSRGLNTKEQIEERLKLAKIEIEQEAKNPFYKYHILNDVFDQAAKNLELIFLKELELSL